MELKQSIIDDLNSLFDGFLESKNIDIENSKLSTNRYNSIMMYLYNTYVSKLEITTNKGFKQYSYIDYITIVEWYINKSLYHDIISIYGLCLLINRSIQFIRDIRYLDSNDICSNFVFDIDNNSICNSDIDINNNVGMNNNIYNSHVYLNMDIEKASLLLINITNKAFEYLQQATVNRLNDTPLGIVTNANNNKDVGLLYAKERIQETAKARLTIALNDLPKLE